MVFLPNVKNVNSELVQNSQADESEAPGSGISRTSPKLVADASSKLANLAGVGEEILNLTPRLGKKPALGSGDDDMIIFDEGPSPRSGHYVMELLYSFYFLQHLPVLDSSKAIPK